MGSQSTTGVGQGSSDPSRILARQAQLLRMLDDINNTSGEILFESLPDVNVSDKQNGYVVAYNSAIEKWVAVPNSGTGGSVTVEDNLTSTSTISALSANQGRVLNEADVSSGSIVGNNLILGLKGGTTVIVDVSALISTIIDNLTSTSATSALSANQGRVLNEADVASGSIVNTDLVLSLKGGSTVEIDVTSLLADVKLSSGTYNSLTEELEFTMSNGDVIAVPVSALIPVSTDSTLVGDGSTTDLGVNLAVGSDVAAGTANKILDASVVIDEDNMSSDSNEHVPTQQSAKAYVDNAVDGLGTTDHEASNLTGRNSLTDLSLGDLVYVVDASSDDTVYSGWAIYRHLGTGVSGSYVDANFVKVSDESSTKNPYNLQFDDNVSWGTPSLGNYTINVPQSTHGFSPLRPIRVDVYEDDGVNWVEVEVDVLVNKSSGDVSITVPEEPDNRFVGRLIIS